MNKQERLKQATIGEGSQINGTLDPNRAFTIHIGKQVVLGGESRVITHCPLRSFLEDDRIIIEDCVWIGYRCIILPGVKIGKFTIIGAGSVVSGDMPAYSVCAGNPCKFIKRREKWEIERWYIQKWKMGREPNKDENMTGWSLTESERRWIFKDY